MTETKPAPGVYGGRMSVESRPVSESVLAGDSVTVSAAGRIKRVYDSQGNAYAERDGYWEAVSARPLIAGVDHFTIVRE